MTTFGSVCSGIEAASVAWTGLGWKAAWFAEIEPFPSAVLKHHYPDVANFGDLTQLPFLASTGIVEAPDILCGGTPCQAFSTAGLRKSLEDPRGNLSLSFCDLANAIDARRETPAIIFWENVPGVLSTRDNAFGCFLAGLAGEDKPLVPAGGKWGDAGLVVGPTRTVAWRVLDAQYFGLAQRRRRVFVVASAREDFDPAAVLFEFEGVRRDTAPSRSPGEEVAVSPTLRAGGNSTGGHRPPGTDVDTAETWQLSHGGNNCSGPIVAAALNAAGGSGRMDFETETFIVHTLRGEGFDASEDRTGRGTPLIAFHHNAQVDQMRFCSSSSSSSLTCSQQAAVAVFDSQERGCAQERNVLAQGVRRLTPRECERLQGFPDDYTAIPYRGKPAADGPRYKALGNSWAVPVVTWIGARIAAQL